MILDINHHIHLELFALGLCTRIEFIKNVGIKLPYCHLYLSPSSLFYLFRRLYFCHYPKLCEKLGNFINGLNADPLSISADLSRNSREDYKDLS